MLVNLLISSFRQINPIKLHLKILNPPKGIFQKKKKKKKTKKEKGRIDFHIKLFLYKKPSSTKFVINIKCLMSIDRLVHQSPK